MCLLSIPPFKASHPFYKLNVYRSSSTLWVCVPACVWESVCVHAEWLLTAIWRSVKQVANKHMNTFKFLFPPPHSLSFFSFQLSDFVAFNDVNDSLAEVSISYCVCVHVWLPVAPAPYETLKTKPKICQNTAAPFLSAPLLTHSHSSKHMLWLCEACSSGLIHGNMGVFLKRRRKSQLV